MPTAFAVHSHADYLRALELIDTLWEAPTGSPEAELLDVMATLVDAYEKHRRTLPPPNPQSLIAFKLRELGWSQRELGRRLGWGSGRVSEVLSGKRALTLGMVRDLGSTLGLPPGLLVADAPTDDGEHVWIRLTRAQAERALARGGFGTDLDRAVEALIEGLEQTATVTVAHGTPSVGAPSEPADRSSAVVQLICLEAA